MTPEQQQEIDALVGALLEQEITAEEHGRLEAMLRNDSACRRRYLALADQHARLLLAPKLAEGARPQSINARGNTRIPSGHLALAAAAAVLMVAGAWIIRHDRSSAAPSVPAITSTEQTGIGCAVLAQTVGAKFIGDHAPRTGAMLSPGTLRLTEGLARIEFFSGATVLLEGKADLQIVSSWEAACNQGKVRVRVPPPARGFRLQAPGMKLVDLGTEFGVQISADGLAHVHVYEGEVEAHPEGAEMRLITGGNGLMHTPGDATVRNEPSFLNVTSIENFDAMNAAHAQSRFDAWSQWSQQIRKDSRLIAYYTFKHWQDDRWDRLVDNSTEPRMPSRAGAAVGAHWTQGRWPMKDALEFRGPGDRVRMDLGGASYQALTLACWVRVDGLDRRYNALLLTDGYEPGEPHWQIYEDGRLMFSVAYPDPAHPHDFKKKRNQIYYSPSIFNLSNQRRWHHIAVTYDTESGAAVQYLDGEEISREVSPYHQPGRSLSFGPCEIGNWGLPTEGHQFPIRNLNGCMDEMLIFKAALNGKEIEGIYTAGKPE